MPVYRVRGRNRSGKQNTETEKLVADATTAKSISESNRTVRRKSYQTPKQRAANARNENQSSESASKDSVSSTLHATQTISSRKNPTTTTTTNHSEVTADLPANHRKTYDTDTSSSTRKTPTGRRYRIRVVEANSINANSQITDAENKVASSTSATGDLKPTLKVKKSDRDVSIDDELNYPEHFKALLKSKKPTASPSLSSGSSRTNNFGPKKSLTSTTTAAPSTDSSSTVRTAYKHKKIDRPNLKLLFPSLQKSSTSTTTESTTMIEDDPSVTDELNTETATPVDVISTTEKMKTTVSKQIGGIKFSSKIRGDSDSELASLPTFRSRSTPLVYDTLKSSTQRIPSGLPTNHRFAPVSGFNKYKLHDNI